MVMLGSNQFLNLGIHPKVIEAGKKAMEKYGAVGHGTSLSGKYDVLASLEKRVAALKGGGGDAIVFPTGYAANLSAISALIGKKDLVVMDAAAHASLVDGGKLSRGTKATFRHNDPNNLDQTLKLNSPGYSGKLVVVDGIYSMDCDIAPLPRIIEVAKKHKARLLVDDAPSNRRGWETWLRNRRTLRD